MTYFGSQGRDIHQTNFEEKKWMFIGVRSGFGAEHSVTLVG